MPQTATEPWIEGTTRIVTVAFFDHDNNAVVPTSASYRIDDVRSKVAILAPTVLTGLAFSVEIVVTAAQNAILGGREFEDHVLTVEWKYGAPEKQGRDDYRFTVRDLAYVI